VSATILLQLCLTRLDFLDLSNLVEPRNVAATLEWSRYENLENFKRVFPGENPRAKRNDIGVVVRSGHPGQVFIDAEGGTNSVYLVRGYLLALAGSANYNSEIRVTRDDGFSGRGAEIRIIDWIRGIGAVIDNLMAQKDQLGFQKLLQFVSCVVAT